MTRIIHPAGPWRNLSAVEVSALEWLDSIINRRRLKPTYNIPTAEAATRFYAQAAELTTMASLK